MTRILVAGATGNLGKRVLEKLKEQGHFLRAIIKKREESSKVEHMVNEIIIADASQSESLQHCCHEIDVVFSSLGKSVSLFSNQDQKTFLESDYSANKNLIEQAKISGVKRFIYVSIYGSDKYHDFELAQVHRKVEKELGESGMSYTIIRPVGLFSGMLDVLRMAKNRAVITIGDGENRTNPIHESDLANICIQAIEKEGNEILEVGGPIILSRNQIAELAIQAAGGNAQHLHIPEAILKGGLPLIQFYDQNFFDKLAFFSHVLTSDVIAPKHGSQKLEEYFHQHVHQLEESWLDLIT